MPLILLIILSISLLPSKSITQAIENLELYESIDFTEENLFTAGIEGPATDIHGNIYAVNYMHKGTVGKVDHSGRVSLFVTLPNGSVGNGIRVNKEGDLLLADYTGHNILRINRKSGEIQVYAHDSRMNQPNDLAITKNQILFLSDPNWSESTGNLWRVNTDGTVQLLEENMGTTNGIEVSPDETKLYVNESVQRNIWVYDLSSKGDLTNKRLFHQFEDFGMDGMRCDAEGNLYVTRHGKGTVVILSKEGDLLHEVFLKGKKPSNITFGGDDGRTCYITLQDRGCFELFLTENPGREWKWYND